MSINYTDDVFCDFDDEIITLRRSINEIYGRKRDYILKILPEEMNKYSINHDVVCFIGDDFEKMRRNLWFNTYTEEEFIEKLKNRMNKGLINLKHIKFRNSQIETKLKRFVEMYHYIIELFQNVVKIYCNHDIIFELLRKQIQLKTKDEFILSHFNKKKPMSIKIDFYELLKRNFEVYDELMVCNDFCGLK